MKNPGKYNFEFLFSCPFIIYHLRNVLAGVLSSAIENKRFPQRPRYGRLVNDEGSIDIKKAYVTS
jgi:hypothetical protein